MATFAPDVVQVRVTARAQDVAFSVLAEDHLVRAVNLSFIIPIVKFYDGLTDYAWSLAALI